jgi:hypothetical protein
MTTRAQLRASIRAELNDSGGATLWSDALLNEFINQAIRTYSRELPKEITTALTVVANQAAYSLPSDFDRAIRVEQPDDTIRAYDPRERTLTDDLSMSESSGATRHGAWAYRIWANQIILDPTPTTAGGDQNITLDYLGRYAEPSVDGDTIATPASDDDILAALACADALRWISMDESKRVRFQQRGRLGAPAPTSMAEAYERRANVIFAIRKRRIRIRGLEVL